jgi:undecaprenyl diphosphate synthase
VTLSSASGPQSSGSLPGVDDDQAILPRHIAIIMDGNGRWARQRGLPRLAGHRAGTENVRRTVRGCLDFGIQVLSLYAFSTENWARPSEEVHGLMAILEELIGREAAALHKEGVAIRHLGRKDELAAGVRQKIQKAEDLTRNNTRMTLNLAFNYGGRREILDAVRRLVADGVDAASLDEETFSCYLYTAGEPDPDLVVRTAGEMRLSNFLIWQASYAEYYSTPAYWPDFDRDELRKALDAYAQRKRKFGKVADD